MTDYSNLVTDKLRILEQADCHYHEELTLDVDGDEVDLFVRTIYGSNQGVPESIYFGRTRRYVLASSKGGAVAIHLDSLREALKDGGHLSKSIDAVIAGLGTKWTGHQYVGTLTEEAEEAEIDIEMMDPQMFIDDELMVWDEAEWVSTDLNWITEKTTDAEIEKWLEEAREFAPSDNVYLTGDATEYLKEKRDDAIAEAEEAA